MKIFKHYILKYFPLCVLILALIWSCEIEEGSEGAVSPESYFGSENGVTKGVTGIFGLYHHSIRPGVLLKDKMIGFTGADDITTMYGANKSAYREADQFNRTGANAWLTDTWVNSYRAIDGINEFIENVDPANFNEEFYNNAIGNARFLRGVIYFDLTLIFGEVPLMLKTGIDHKIKRSSVKDVLEQVQKDLEFAAQWVINEERDTKGGVDAKSINGHASKTAAKAYLAKVHMALAGWPVKENYDENWTKVRQYTKEIIDEGIYSLLDDYAQNFGNVGVTFTGIDVQDWEGNKEAVWSRICNESANNGTHGRFNGFAWYEWGDFFLEWHFYERMPDDYRTQYSTTDNSTWDYWGFVDYPYPADLRHPTIMKFHWGAMSMANFKNFKGLSRTDPDPEDFPGREHDYDLSNDVAVIRHAEVLLMYAEACARTGVDVADGTEKLNWVRRRAYANGLPAVSDTIDNAIAAGILDAEYWKNPQPAVDYPQAGETDLIKAILDERSWEFIGELGGIRWFDLTRLEMVGEATSTRDTPGQSDPDKAELPLIGDPSDVTQWRFPIPSVEFSYNSDL